MSDLALRLIRENIEAHARGEDATYLDLGNCGMIELPEEIYQCHWLEVLILSSEWYEYDLKKKEWTDKSSQNTGEPNTLTFLPPVHNLVSLQKIVLSGTQLADLSPLAGLSNLQQLSCDSTLVADLSPLAGLSNLQQLSCDSTYVVDLTPLAGLSNLQQFYCYDTQVADLSPLAGLLNLQEINLNSTQVSDLSPLAGLLNLQRLSCHTTQVCDLSPLANLLNLKLLWLDSTKVSDLSPLSALLNLQQLWCHDTLVSDLSPLLPLIKKGTKVKWAKYEIGICIEDSPLIHPPVDIVQQGNAAILRYFEDLETQGEEIVYEAKMLILGDAGAGKTTLARKIENPDAEMPDEEKDSTPGIAVRSLLLAGQPNFTIHIWDFGGQEVYHATHQFFLSKRSLYVLLADGRKEEQLDYWLQMQEIYGQDSRLLIVVNQKADMRPNLPMSDIRRDYPNVQEAQPTVINFKTDRNGAIALRQHIERTVRNLPQFEQGLRTPKKWANIRRQLEALEVDHITLADYRTRCSAEGITEKIRQDDLLDFLHHLGGVLYFKDVAGLNKMVILKPEWATKAVYRLLDHTQKKGSDGHFTRSDLDAVWQCAEYEDYFEELLLLIEKFELCYPVPEQKGLYIVPSLLPDNAPEDYSWPAAATDLQLSYEYSFMPKGIVTRLIVRQHALLKQPPIVWKRGAVFTIEGASAELVESYRDKRINIRATGRAAKSLLTLLARDLDALNQGFHFNERMTLRAMVPCNCTGCEKVEKNHRFEYGNLLYRLQNGRNTIECDKSFQPVNIPNLLRETFSDVDAILHEIEWRAKAERHGGMREG